MRLKEGPIFGLGGTGNVFPEHFGRQRRIAFYVDQHTGPVVEGQADSRILFCGSFAALDGRIQICEAGSAAIEAGQVCPLFGGVC